MNKDDNKEKITKCNKFNEINLGKYFDRFRSILFIDATGSTCMHDITYLEYGYYFKPIYLRLDDKIIIRDRDINLVYFTNNVLDLKSEHINNIDYIFFRGNTEAELNYLSERINMKVPKSEFDGELLYTGIEITHDKIHEDFVDINSESSKSDIEEKKSDIEVYKFDINVYEEYKESIMSCIKCKSDNGIKYTEVRNYHNFYECPYGQRIKKELKNAGYSVMEYTESLYYFDVSWFSNDEIDTSEQCENDITPSKEMYKNSELAITNKDKFNEKEYMEYKKHCIDLINKSKNTEITCGTRKYSTNCPYATKLKEELKKFGYKIEEIDGLDFKIKWIEKNDITSNESFDDIPYSVEMNSISKSYIPIPDVFDETKYNDYKLSCINRIKECAISGSYSAQYATLFCNKECVYAKKLKKELMNKGYTITDCYNSELSFYVNW